VICLPAAADLATLLDEQQQCDPAPSVDAEPCTSSHILTQIATQSRTIHFAARLSTPREDNMFKLIGFQFAPTAAYEIGLRGGVPSTVPLPRPSLPKSIIRDGADLLRQQASDRYRCVSAAIDRIGFRQSLFNPHTSTALTA
jgi:hypothetical protein